MARTIRVLSNSNIYHIVLKGNNSEVLFYDDSDYSLFLHEIRKACDQYNAEILAYCVMNNHIHMIIKFFDVNISNIFKSFGASFAYKYNRKHDRTGRIFNSRYYSKAIESNDYLFAALRYIHLNPVKAGLCNEPIEYKWSSYNDYDFGESEIKQITDIDFIKELLSEEQFKELHSKKESVDNVVWDYIICQSVKKPTSEETEKLINYVKNNYEDEVGIEMLRKAKVASKTICEAYSFSRRSWEIYRNNN